MKPAPFKYFAAANVEEAIELLANDDQARPLAGGQSLVPMMNLRLARPSLLVDLNRISGLSNISEHDGSLCIGSMTRQSALLSSPLVRRLAPLITEALAFVGHPPTRARGTMGGSIANADPAAELPVVALALNAQFVVRGKSGERVIRAADFFRGMFETAIGQGELLTEIRVAPRLPRSGHAFFEFARRNGDFAIVSAAVNLTLNAKGRCTSSRIIFGGIGPIPVHGETVEAQLQGCILNETAIEAGANAIDAKSIELESRGATARYRLHLARVLLKRALQQAAHAAGNN